MKLYVIICYLLYEVHIIPITGDSYFHAHLPPLLYSSYEHACHKFSSEFKVSHMLMIRLGYTIDLIYSGLFQNVKNANGAHVSSRCRLIIVVLPKTTELRNPGR
jgi:hypothetical protein